MTDLRLRLVLSLLACCALTLNLGACAPKPTPALFIPPGNETRTSIPETAVSASSALPLTATTQATLPTSPVICEDNLTFIQDLTVPDGSIILPGGSIDKQWLVQNSGTCNWDSGYRIKLVAGESLGALTEQALYPAKAGNQAALRILFTAPLESGTYQSAWQAYTPDGSIFGDPVFMQIIVE